MKTIKLKLKTLKQIKSEFRTYNSHGDIHFKGSSIYIDELMFKYFGKEIDVIDKLESDGNIAWYDMNGWSFLTQWIQPNDFIEEDEFMID